MRVILIACVESCRPLLLDHFLKHHCDLGITDFALILHQVSDRSESDGALSVLDRYRIRPADIWSGEFDSVEKHRRLSELFEATVREEDWVIPADLDEFRVFPARMTEFLAACERGGFLYVSGQLLDRISLTGQLPTLTAEPSLWRQFPLACRVTHSILGAWTAKVVALKGLLRFGQSHHHLDDGLRDGFRPFEYPEVLDIHHFKWDASLIRRLRERVAVYRRLELGWYEESERLLTFLERNGGILEPAHPDIRAFPVAGPRRLA